MIIPLPVPQPPPMKENIIKGTWLTILAFFFFAVFGIFLKLDASKISPIWINFIAYLVGLIIFTPIILWRLGRETFRIVHLPYHIGRAAFGVTASTLYTMALKYIPLLNATLLFNTTPIFIPLFAFIMMKTKIHWSVWPSIILGFIGIYLIIDPSFSTLFKPGNLVGLLSGIFLAIAFVFIKMLTPTNRPLSIVFYFFLFATILQLPILFFLPEWPNEMDWILSICAGIALALAQIFVTSAYQYADASKIGVFQYSGIIFVALFDWILWNVLPGPSEIIGTILVVIAGALIITSPQWIKLLSNNNSTETH